MRVIQKQFVRFERAFIWGGGILAALLALFFGVTVFAQAHTDEAEVHEGTRLITLYDRGAEQSFVTDKRTVREALEQADIELDPRDRVEPSLDEELVANEYSINIYRARPLIVVDGIARYHVISSAQTPAGIAKDADITLYDEDEAMFRRAASVLDGAAEQLVITRATAFSLTLYGDTMTVRTQAETVGDFLAERNITLAENDRMSKQSEDSIAEDMKLRVWREGKQTVTVDETVKFDTEEIQDADREVGYRQVRTAGANGKASVTYEVLIRDGKEVSRKEVSRIVKEKPTKEVVVVGAKFNYTGGPLNDAQIQALGTCESGMTATRNSGNGFYGAFQFMHSTWQAVAPAPYSGDYAHKAPLDAQKQAVQNLLSRSSIYTQFPSCARQMQARGIL